MANIKKIQRKLNKKFDGRVQAVLEDGIIRLTGELDNWDDVVTAGETAATKNSLVHVVNDIKFTGGEIPPMRVPSLRDNAVNGKTPDVLIIGGGITGCAIARELSKWEMNVMLIEKNADFAMGASGANDGEVHVGIDLKKGSLKQKYVLLGNAMYDKFCSDLDVPFRRPGQYILFTQLWLLIPIFFFYIRRKYIDGVKSSRFMWGSKIKREQPTFDKKIKFGIYNDNAGVVCSYGLTIACAENAAENGVEAYLNTAVLSMDTNDSGNIIAVHTNRGTIKPTIVINAAGVFADDIAEMAHDRFYSIHPRRGTNAIQDTKSANIIDCIASIEHAGIGSFRSKTKGGGIMRTVDDNVLVGPDAVECFDKEDTSTYPESLKTTYTKQKGTVPAASERDIITYFTGIRAATFEEDFVLEWGRKCPNMFHCGGIQSPGLTAAPAIAADVEKIIVDRLSKKREILQKKKWTPVRRGVPRLKEMIPARRSAMIARNPDYGIIVCRCEEISKGEIIDCLERPLCPPTVDAVKKRIRPGMGRCQGGFCQPLVAQIIAEHENIDISEVRKASAEAVILYGENKGGAEE